MKNAKPKKPVTRLVTLVIVGLCVFFAGFIVFSYIQKKRPASPARTSPGSPPGQAQAAEARAAGPGGQGQGAGGTGSPQTPAQNATGQSMRTGNQAPGSGPGTQAQQGQTAQTSGQGTGGAGTRGTAVRVTPIKLDTIENTVIINGDVLARTQVSVYPTVAGKLAEARFKVGDLVRQGEILAMIDPSRPGEVYSKSPVVSPVSGTVLSAPVNPGDTLSTQTAVYLVGDLSGLLVETFVPERFTAAAQKGLTAQVSFEAIPGETFPMTVDEVSPVLDPASRTLKIRLRFTKPDSRIKAGMFATVTLVTGAKHNVPVIPRSAVINTYGSWIVFTVREGTTAERREIKLGLESEDFIEVVSGLNPGEQVVTAGQNFLSDGDPVRIVEG